MNTSHIMRISKILRDLCFTKQRIKTKNTFARVVCSVLKCGKYLLAEHKEVCLSIDGAQFVKLWKGTIKFKNCFKQIPVPFKTYADFGCNLESTESYQGSYSKKYQDHIPCSLAYKLVCVDDKFTKPIVVFRGENADYEFLKQFLKSMNTLKKWQRNILTKIWSWVKKNYFSQVTLAGFVANSLKITMKKLDTIVT